MALIRQTNKVQTLAADVFLRDFLPELQRRREYADIRERAITGYDRQLVEAVNDHEYFGLHRLQDGRWVFREYAPNAQSIVLTGDFSDWKIDQQYALALRKNGVWEGVFPANTFQHGTHYKMFVAYPGGCGMRIPAYARYVLQDGESKLFSAAVWEPEEPFKFTYPAPPPAAPLIYEAHVGIAQEEAKVGTYREFAEKILPEISRKGYNTVQLMGIMEHPYYGSFGYHVANFFAVSSRFGTPDDFKYLVDTAHRLNLRVIIDLVHSHAVKNVEEGLAEIDGSRTTYFHSGSRGEHEAWDSLCFDYGKLNVLRFLLSNCRFAAMDLWLKTEHAPKINHSASIIEQGNAILKFFKV